MAMLRADFWDVLVIVGLVALIGAAYLAGGWVWVLGLFGAAAVVAGLAGAWRAARPER